jgi:hypothetical protein
VGRGESPLDPDGGPVQRFAYDLRRLRQRAGSPTYRALAARTHYSLTSMSHATSGRALPSLSLTRAFVQACGEDPATWERRWHEVAGASHPARPMRASPTDASAAVVSRVGGSLALASPEVPGPEAKPPPQIPPSKPPKPARRRWAGRRLGLTIGVMLPVAVIVTIAVLLAYPRDVSFCLFVVGPAAPQQAAAASAVIDGADPSRAGCDTDAVIAAANSVRFPANQVVGTLQLRYSVGCRAEWVRFEPVGGWNPGAGTMVTVWATRPVDQATQARSVEFNGQAIVSGMLMTVRGPVIGGAVVVRGATESPIALTTTFRTAGLRVPVSPATVV